MPWHGFVRTWHGDIYHRQAASPQGRDEKWSNRGDVTLVHTRWECSDLLKSTKRSASLARVTRGSQRKPGHFQLSIYIFSVVVSEFWRVRLKHVGYWSVLQGSTAGTFRALIYQLCSGWRDATKRLVYPAPRWENVKWFLSTQPLGAHVAEPRESIYHWREILLTLGIPIGHWKRSNITFYI